MDLSKETHVFHFSSTQLSDSIPDNALNSPSYLTIQEQAAQIILTQSLPYVSLNPLNGNSLY